MNASTFRVKSILVAKFFKFLTKNELGCYLSHRDIGHFRKKWNRTAGTWIDLNNVDFFILDDKLNVHHSEAVKTDC